MVAGVETGMISVGSVVGTGVGSVIGSGVGSGTGSGVEDSEDCSDGIGVETLGTLVLMVVVEVVVDGVSVASGVVEKLPVNPDGVEVASVVLTCGELVATTEGVVVDVEVAILGMVLIVVVVDVVVSGNVVDPELVEKPPVNPDGVEVASVVLTCGELVATTEGVVVGVEVAILGMLLIVVVVDVVIIGVEVAVVGVEVAVTTGTPPSAGVVVSGVVVALVVVDAEGSSFVDGRSASSGFSSEIR